jgi:hypothetical protein
MSRALASSLLEGSKEKSRKRVANGVELCASPVQLVVVLPGASALRYLEAESLSTIIKRIITAQ